MSHLKMNFATALDSTQYNLVCTNHSSTDWVFYVYQTMPNQPREIFSLAWFASPYKIASGNKITFSWGIDYSFVWGQTGTVAPGVLFSASGVKPCSLTGANQTTFSLDNNAPQLSTPTTGGQAGSLTIKEAPNVPNSVFSTGIGMSNHGTFVQQAYANTTQVYTPEPKYWIAAANQMQMGVVLAQTVTQAMDFAFPSNVYTLYADLGEDNTWVITT
jgi:rhizosphere induced protein